MRRRDTTSLDGLRRQPAGAHRLQTKIAVGHLVAALGVAAHYAPLCLAELHPLGHHRHDWDSSMLLAAWPAAPASTHGRWCVRRVVFGVQVIAVVDPNLDPYVTLSSACLRKAV